MKAFLAVVLVILVGVVAYFAYVLDQWLGLVAYTGRYLLFCVVAAFLLGGASFVVLRKYAAVAGLAFFAILAANFLVGPPSERILRSCLLRIPPGTDADAIENVVRERYAGSGYALPRISRDESCVTVSLVSQESGNCSAIMLKTKDGVVVGGEFSAD